MIFRIWLFLCLVFIAVPCSADILATRNLIKGTQIAVDDVTNNNPEISDGLTEKILGMETRRLIYKGFPITESDVGPPTIVQRNDLIKVRLVHKTLEISTIGRALDPGGVGELIRIMNIDSRKVLTGQILDAQSAVIKK